MSGIRSLLHKFTAERWLQVPEVRSFIREFHARVRDMKDPHPVSDATATATATHSGLMSADDKKKLNRIEANATGDMTASELVSTLELYGKPFKIDVAFLEGKGASDFARRDHKHDDRYLPRDQMNDWITQIDSVLRKAFTKADENDATLSRALDMLAHTIADCFTPEAIETLLSRLEATRVNAARLSGKTLEDLDCRYLSATDPFLKGGIRSQAVNGGLIRTGQFSPDVAKGNLWRYSNGGDHTFVAPKTNDDFELKCVVLHHPQFAGVITFDFPLSSVKIDGITTRLLGGEHYRGGAHLISMIKIGPFVDVDVRRVG